MILVISSDHWFAQQLAPRNNLKSEIPMEYWFSPIRCLYPVEFKHSRFIEDLSLDNKFVYAHAQPSTHIHTITYQEVPLKFLASYIIGTFPMNFKKQQKFLVDDTVSQITSKLFPQPLVLRTWKKRGHF